MNLLLYYTTTKYVHFLFKSCETSIDLYESSTSTQSSLPETTAQRLLTLSSNHDLNFNPSTQDFGNFSYPILAPNKAPATAPFVSASLDHL